MTKLDVVMLRDVVATAAGRRVVAVDTIAHVAAEDAGQVVVTGSHGGISSAEYAGRVPVAAVFFNDAGIGKDDAGIAGLRTLDEMGIAAGAVSHDTAAIGEALETWNGTLTAVNPCARAAGFSAGEVLRDAVARVYGGAA